jgi:hypothetical protein
MTYPDLVPEISGFKEWFFIGISGHVIPIQAQPTSIGRWGLPEGRVLKDSGR